MTGTVLILGASGKVGVHAARAFAAAGWQVRNWRRGTDMTAAALGADVIVNGLNPPAYHDWDRLIPAITAQVVAAAQTSGATVILPGNIYNFGLAPGVIDADTPRRPNSRKGRIREEMEQAYRAAGVRTIVLRAGNFIAPGSGSDVMALLYLRGLRRGRFTYCGGPDVMQAHAYMPDWARAAAGLAARRADLPAFADIPFPGHAFAPRDLHRAIEAATGRPLRAARFPWWMMRLAAPVWELARELLEMRYLWDMPHELSGHALERWLPDFRPTPLDVVVSAILADQVDPDQPVRTGRQGEVVAGLARRGPEHA